MPKLPKFSELTDIQGMMGKVKSAIDSMTGPDTSVATEQALAEEKDPMKAKLLEIELLINQLHDVQIIQSKTVSALKSKYAEVKKLAAVPAPAPSTTTEAMETKAEETPPQEQESPEQKKSEDPQ